MIHKPTPTTIQDTTLSQKLSISFGIVTVAAGLINTFWGNDSLFGIFLILLSFAFFPFSTRILFRMTGFAIPGVIKIVLALFIVWVTLGVGEIFAKIGLMMKDLG
ncbi:hypothetical protein LZZ85_03185 [Terrimonas sp. NA20]|uniref:AI-2E family transporter n=1 Tax=Terrimonas ginsenosidimutans TaxID=2908004 RepID=A0ABS9KLR2_9BACT|nr:hypothetical protein [Terrimonas ginsenosidimutans]MCG2613262.1 hypothetical protein [Terrimonas ginsenosidimutans]